MDRLRLKTAIPRGLILVLALLLPSLAAADDYCRIDSKFNVRDLNMNLIDADLSGRRVCHGSELVKEYFKDGVKKRGTFRMVKAGADTVLVSAAAVTVTGPVPAAPVPATKSAAMQLATGGGLAPSNSGGGSYGGGTAGSAVSTSQYIADPGFAVRKDPKKTGEQIAQTGEQPVRVMVSGGKPVVENSYVKVQYPTTGNGTRRPSIGSGYVHQSAFTNLSEPFKPSLATGGSIADTTSVGGEAAAVAFKPAVVPSAPLMTVLSEGEKPGQVSLGETPIEGSGVTTLPPQTQADAKPEAKPEAALTTETAAIEETVIPQSVTEEPAEASEPAITPPAIAPLQLGGNQFFRNVPAKNWAKAKTVLNLRDKPGTGGDSKVLMQIKAGGRFAVAGMQEVGGKKWFKVVPLDCDELTVENNSGATCNQVFWVSGEHVSQVAAPSAAEITGRMAWGQTEAAVACTECDPTRIQGLDDFNDIEDLSQFIQAAVSEGSLNGGVASDAGLDVFEDYMAVRAGFMKGSIKAEFDAATRTSTKKAVAAKYRDAFIKYIKDNMPEARANAVILALTAYGEARNESVGGENQRKAEMAMVFQTIMNRRNFQEGRYNLMHYALANWQFSVWNRAPHTDVNLFTMMNAGSGDPALKRAFETYAQMQSGQIKAIGDMAKERTRHYYAPGASPAWRNDGRRIDAQFQMPDGSVMTVKSHRVMYGVS